MSIDGLRTRVEAGRRSGAPAGGLVSVRGRDSVPIIERLDDQRRVRLVIAILDSRFLDGDVLDHTGLVSHRHNIIHTNGALEQQDKTTHKIADGLLETEAYAD